VGAVTDAHLPDPATLADAVGPVGGSAARLLDAWGERHRQDHRQYTETRYSASGSATGW
jgi:hypothetical protein